MAISKKLALVLSVASAYLPTGSAKPCTKRSLPCAVSSFTGAVTLPGVTVTIVKADHVPQNGSYGDATDLGFPQPIDMLPELCAVTVKVVNTTETPTRPASSYSFGIFLPVKWNERFMTVGGASFSGGINWQGST